MQVTSQAVDETLNTGLSSQFFITETGAFSMIGGIPKSVDNVNVHLSFQGFFRKYFEDYVPDVFAMWQKPSAQLERMKIIYFAQIQASFRKYSPFVKVNKMNVQSVVTNRRIFIFLMEYSPRLFLQQAVNLVTATFISA